MNSNKLYTPLRYPGGKAFFAPFIAQIMMQNGLTGGHYLEPYAGGAGVALELLFHDHASHVHINDIDPAIYAFWYAVTQETTLLLDLLEDTPISIEQWFKWRDIFRGKVVASSVEHGFATLFMNRTNRSGILMGGVIGGKAQDGQYKLDARFKKDVISKRIQKIAKFSNRISVYNKDSLNLLQNCVRFLPKKSLIYLDPPYYVKGQGLYRNYYVHQDHLAIAKKLQSSSFNRSWVVSYDNTKEIQAMYQLSQGLSYGLNYSAQKRYIGNEVLFSSRNLSIPEGQIPRGLSAA